MTRAVVLAFSFLAGCETTASGDGGDDGGDSAGDDGMNGGMCMPNDGDGATACSVDGTCSGATYCDTNGFCANGCLSSLNCPAGQYCDLRMSTPNFDNTLQVGICHVPGGECGSGDDGPATSSDSAADDTGQADETAGTPLCDDVQGNHQMQLDTDNPELCGDAFSGLTMCSIAQDGCDLTWGCDADFGLTFPPGPIDDRTYTGMGSFMGAAFECTAEWVYGPNFTFTFSCSANVGGMAIVCEGVGI